jgi:hypothetical protein
MHDANGLLTMDGTVLQALAGVVLLALASVAVGWLAAQFFRGSSSEDRDAMDRVDSTMALFAPRSDDPERRDDAHDSALVSQVRLDLARDRARRQSSSVNRRLAEAREGRRVPPAA